MAEWTTSLNVMRQIGTATGTGGMPILTTVASLSLIDGFWCGLDDGFFPWDYLPYYADDYYPYDYYADSQPSDNTESVDNSVPAADPTVEATQEELAQLGYYNGPVDGIFGPTTRDAVANYQIAKQLNVTGSLSPDTMQSLGLPEPASN